MPTSETKLKKLEEILKMMDENLSKEDFVKAFKNVINIVRKAENTLTDKTNGAVSDLKGLFNDLEKKLESTTNAELSRVVRELRGIAEKALKDQSVSLNFIRDKVRKIKEGKDGKDGKPGIDGKDGMNGKDGSPDKPKEIRDKLEGLDGKERLEIKAVNNLQEELDKLKDRIAKKQVLRGGGGLSKMAMDRHILDPYTPTGTVDGSNTDFELTKTPNPATSLMVWQNGIKQQLTTNYTVSGTTVTFLIAPVTGETIEVSHRF